MAREKILLLTGGTGFLGRNLIPSLVKNDYQVHILSRSKEYPPELRQFESNPRVSLLEADVLNPKLIEDEQTRKRYQQELTHFYHLVASTSFDEKKRAETEAMNIGGTENVINFLRGCPNLQNLSYVSTAYVANRDQAPRILEDQQLPQIGFGNPYESSKWTAEQRVRESGLPFSIFRPSIFSGDSITGSTNFDYRMGYGVLIGLLLSAVRDPQIGTLENYWKLREKLKDAPSETYPHINCRLRGYEDVTKNFMFIDDIAEQISGIATSGKDISGKTFHIVTRNPITTKQMLNSMQKALRLQGFRFAGDLQREGLNPVERRAERYVNNVYAPYFLRHEPMWDTTNTDVCLNGYKRKEMTPEKFDWLMEKYVDNELPQVLNKLDNRP